MSPSFSSFFISFSLPPYSNLSVYLPVHLNPAFLPVDFSYLMRTLPLGRMVAFASSILSSETSALWRDPQNLYESLQNDVVPMWNTYPVPSREQV